MDIPGLGKAVFDESLECYCFEERPVRAFGGLPCRIAVADYEEDEGKEDFHRAIRNFLDADQAMLNAATAYVFEYYQDIDALLEAEGEDDGRVHIAKAEDVWKHVQLGNEPLFIRRADGDMAVYVSIECNCAWEPEHGLELVFRDGHILSKVGPYDGHLTNADAYDAEELENVIYVPISGDDEDEYDDE